MVAISLYRGNLHRVPDVPRRWLMPTPRFSLKDFRILLHRRSKALSLLNSPSSSSAPFGSTSSANPNTNSPSPPPHLQLPPPKSPPQAREEAPEDEKPGCSDVRLGISDCVKLVVEADSKDEVRVNEVDCDVEVVDQVALLIGGLADAEVEASDPVELGKDENGEGLYEENAEAAAAAVEPLPSPGDEENNKLVATDVHKKRKREVEEKLQLLNKKKHNLVQALKQILNAEEELKRRSTAQATRPSLPLHVDVTTEGGEADDASNNNLQSRQLLRMSSASPSPSSDSALRKPPYFQHSPVISNHYFFFCCSRILSTFMSDSKHVSQ
ncbi:hypothetical protein Dimus_004829 [Dionaea muscipula]